MLNNLQYGWLYFCIYYHVARVFSNHPQQFWGRYLRVASFVTVFKTNLHAIKKNGLFHYVIRKDLQQWKFLLRREKCFSQWISTFLPTCCYSKPPLTNSRTLYYFTHSSENSNLLRLSTCQKPTHFKYT